MTEEIVYGKPEEVAADIFRIRLPLPDNPLKMLNSYFIRGDESDLLIDTGFRRPECREALDRGLAALGSEKERRGVLCTHLHADHSGNADLYAGEEQPLYMTKTDLEHLARYLDRSLNRVRFEIFRQGGFPVPLLEENERRNQSVTMVMPAIDPRFRTLGEGDEIRAGRYTLTTLMMPGHTPGNAMFYLESERIMFTGDHVLFDITPNITNWPDMEDALGTYIASLHRARTYDVKLALPGHRGMGDYHARIDAILAHHERRLADTKRIIGETPGLSAYEIASRMKWKIRAESWEAFPLQQKWFATGECFAHLDYLLRRGEIGRTEEDGVFRYHPA